MASQLAGGRASVSKPSASVYMSRLSGNVVGHEWAQIPDGARLYRRSYLMPEPSDV